MSGDNTTRGILAMIAFAMIAPGMDAFAKATPSEIPVVQVLGFRFGIQAALLVPLAFYLGVFIKLSYQRAFVHFLRALALLVATGFFFAALRHMPIANAIAIFFVEPFVVALMGAVFLGEGLGPRRLMACAVGFIGAMLVIQPSFSELGLPALYPLATAVTFATYIILTRRVADQAHPVAIQAFTALAATAIAIPFLVLYEGSGNELFDPTWPSSFGWFTLMGVGVISSVSHLILSYALRLAPASAVAPFQYFEIVAATGLGLIFFGDFPDTLTWIGIAIIVGSGLYFFAREAATERAV